MVSLTPEQQARERIDQALEQAGWLIQDYDDMNIDAGRGVAIREYRMKRGHGYADYLLYVDGFPCGALEAKRADSKTVSGVMLQAKKYSDGLPTDLAPPIRPLPFLYVSNGHITDFLNRLDPEPRSRRIFAPHRPETLAEWLKAEPHTARNPDGSSRAADSAKRHPDSPGSHRLPDWPSTLRSRLARLPPIATDPDHKDAIPGMWPNQLRAIHGLEQSLAADKPRALIQMASLYSLYQPLRKDTAG